VLYAVSEVKRFFILNLAQESLGVFLGGMGAFIVCLFCDYVLLNVGSYILQLPIRIRLQAPFWG
jgi:hypothetical protein